MPATLKVCALISYHSRHGSVIISGGLIAGAQLLLSHGFAAGVRYTNTAASSQTQAFSLTSSGQEKRNHFLSLFNFCLYNMTLVQSLIVPPAPIYSSVLLRIAFLTLAFIRIKLDVWRWAEERRTFFLHILVVLE